MTLPWLLSLLTETFRDTASGYGRELKEQVSMLDSTQYAPDIAARSFPPMYLNNVHFLGF